ncbi:MAG: phosphate ABC transporter permease subunit PstC [Streptococcaceae bacterium]|jgi:phosphate transport system permease protein|nr:phosphate ABC transporter permease subunit PstC [Streptococcaceae bacterium]
MQTPTTQPSDIAQKLTAPSKNSRLENIGRTITFICIAIICAVVLLILVFVAQKGLSTFFINKINPFNFIFGTNWAPGSLGPDGKPAVGALPMIAGSFIVTILSALVATPFAIGAGIYMTEISPKIGARILQPVIELLVGIPSVVYGFIGLTVVVPLIRGWFGGTGLGLLSGVFVLFVMILPTVTSMTVDSLRAIPAHYREASLGLGATRWQTIWRVLLRAATPGILTAVIFGMARAFGEALAIQMVVGNAIQMPTSLLKPASTLTSILTSGIPNATPGLQTNALWSLALLLLLMSLVFNLIMRAVAKRSQF